MENKNFSERLRYALEQKGITQTNLGRMIGVSKTNMSYYISGKNKPRENKIKLMADKLGVDPAWLAGYKSSVLSPEVENKQLRASNNELLEQLETYIPRRRVRRIYKMLGDILEEKTDTTQYVEILKEFINKIEKEGKAEAGQEIKTAIEHLLSVRER